MIIPILVQSENGNGYRAELLPTSAFVGEGATPEDAVKKLRERFQARLDQGEIAYLEIGKTDNPWLKLIGVYKDDPYLEEYKQAIADYRKQVDADPDRL